MSYIYLPRTHRFRAFTKSSNNNFTSFYFHRKHTLIEIHKLINCVLLFVLLIIGFRIGTIALMVLSNLDSFYATSYCKGIHIPYIENKKRFVGSSRHKLYISIHKDGKILFDGLKIDKNDWVNYFNQERAHDPQIVACFLADRNCRMELINEVISYLRKSDIKKMFFVTSTSDNIYL